MFVKARTGRRNCAELTWFSFWRTDQWASRTSSYVTGWRVREYSHACHRRR